MTAPTQIIVDALSRLRHKAILPVAGHTLPSGVVDPAPTWCPPSEADRMRAYVVRAAYRSNVARLVLPPPTGGDDDDRDQHREYGDADLLVDRVKAGVLGTDWSVEVDGAADDLSAGPTLPERPPVARPVDGEGNPVAVTEASPAEDRIAATLWDRFDADVEEVLDAWAAAMDAQPELRARQADVDAWADAIGLRPLMDELEDDVVGLGDGVVVLWHRDGDWPRPQIIDPSGYFPVIDEGDNGDFPRKVHLAWEVEDIDPATRKVTRSLRRITFELVPLNDVRVGVDDDGASVWLDAAGNPTSVPRADERVNGATVERLYPWNRGAGANGEDIWSDTVCLYSDGTWSTEDIGNGVEALDDGAATWTAYRADVGVDFLPLVHLPNTPTGKEHFGRSVVDGVAQLLDDVADADTGAWGASQFIKKPSLALKDGAVLDGNPVTAPGMIYQGELTALDLGTGLGKIMEYNAALLDRFLVNAKMPKPMVGKVDGTGQVSGVRLAIEMAPFGQVVSALRAVRAPKWSLIFRFAQRMAQAQGALDPGSTPTVRLAPGPFLPSDLAGVVEWVTSALQGHAISTETAVAALVHAGAPVADARAEAERIRAENTSAAVDLVAALGDAGVSLDDRVRVLGEALGVDLEVQADPAPTVPPTPGAPPSPVLDGLPPTSVQRDADVER